jgi:hypothetical protein
VINLKQELERELTLIESPDLWDRIQDAARHGSEEAVVAPPPRPPRRAALLVVAAGVMCLLALVGSTLLREEVQTVDTTPATGPIVDATSDEGSSTVDVQISSCRGGSGLVTASFAVTKQSSIPSLKDASDYVVRIKVVGDSGPIGEAVTIVRDVRPERQTPAQAFAPIADSTLAGTEVTNCLLENVQRVPGT